VLAIHRAVDVEARTLALVERVVVQERHDDAVLAVLALTGEVEGREAAMQLGGGVGVAAVAALPAAIHRTKEVEAAVGVMIHVGEQRG
jgi:hypothetical protein